MMKVFIVEDEKKFLDYQPLKSGKSPTQSGKSPTQSPTQSAEQKRIASRGEQKVGLQER
jgi:hypothetical protein